MVLPGIKKDTLAKLGEADTASVLDHVKRVKAAVRRKKDIISGRIPELGETRPESEAARLEKVLEAVEAAPEMVSDISALLENVRGLLDSVKEEHGMMERVEKYKGAGFEEIQKEMSDEMAIGRAIEHQLNLLYNIKAQSPKAVHHANQLPEPRKSEAGGAVEILNDTTSYLVRLIFEEELPHLSVAYSLLKLDEWPEIEARIQSIKSSFEELEPKAP